MIFMASRLYQLTRMRLFFVLLLVAMVLMSESDAWRRRRRRRRRRWLRIRGRRVFNFVKEHRATITAIIKAVGKRSIDDLDKNKDGYIDQSEAEELMERRAAEDLLSLADENGDSDVSMEELSRSIDSFLITDADPGLREEQGESHTDAVEQDAE